MAIKVILVAGEPPNCMKVAPIMAAMAGDGRVVPYLVHTGQHYDQRMSKLFFEELGIPKPDIDLGVGSGSCPRAPWRSASRRNSACACSGPRIRCDMTIRSSLCATDPDQPCGPGECSNTLTN